MVGRMTKGSRSKLQWRNCKSFPGVSWRDWEILRKIC